MRIASKLLTSRRFIDSFAQRVGATEAAGSSSREPGGLGNALKSARGPQETPGPTFLGPRYRPRSEEHTSELQSRGHLVCRLLLEKKNKKAGESEEDERHRNA